jgi:CelD/BcsL family acetyltransferase involved in cellulose biosynthesis
VWRDGSDLIGVAPLSLVADRPPLRPVKQLAFWGTIGPRLRGLVDVLAPADRRAEVVDGFATWLRETRDWDLIRVVRPQVGSTTPERLRGQAKASGWSYRAYSNIRSTTYQLDLPADAEGWQKHLGSKARKVMRWEMRKFADFRGGRIETSVERPVVVEALDAAERLLRERWGEGEVNFRNDPMFRVLLHDAVPAMAEHDGAWVTVARDEAGIQGVLVSLVQNGYAMALTIAMTTDESYKPFSLGKHLFDTGIAEAVRRGCHNYDFLWVGGYKESFWHATPRHLETALIGRGLVGKLAARALVGRF